MNDTIKRGPGRPAKQPVTDAATEALLRQLAAIEPQPQEEQDEEPQPAIDPMVDAPRDGRRLLLVNPTGGHVLGYWRMTRGWSEGRWQDRAFWAVWRGPDPVPFSPSKWAPAE